MAATASTGAVPSFRRVEAGSYDVPLAKFPAPNKASAGQDPVAAAEDVITNFNIAIAKKDFKGIADLFVQEESYWRDHLALTWDFRTSKAGSGILAFLQECESECKEGFRLTKVEIDSTAAHRAPHITPIDGFGEVDGVEFFITFETVLGVGQGVVRLANVEGKWQIFSIYTALKDIKGHEETIGARRSKGVEHGGKPDRKNWLERRAAEETWESHEPAVMVIGAGHSGLTIGARLKMLGVPCLIIDRFDEVGDNWRKRYHQLVLHDPIWYDHLPYIPFPETWPIFTPKDKIAQWFQSYAQALELSIWCKTTMKSSSYDDSTGTWTIVVERTLADGSVQERTFHPRHMVQATGHAGKKNFPSHLPGINDFQGDRLCHSSEFSGAKPNGNGKKALVIGCCNSGHDICQDFYEKGYNVTMVQRSTTCVISSEAISKIGLKGAYDENSPPTADSDLKLFGTPSSVLKALQIKVTADQEAFDKVKLEGLAKAGFGLDRGPEGAGLLMKYFQRGGGYYIDVGCSQLVIDGKIKMKQGSEIVEVLPRGLKFADGEELEADEVIFATGYANMRTEARLIFGDEVADRIGDIWGFDKEGEFRAIWRKSGHPGFWFMGGNLALARYYSKMVALQIKALEEKITTYTEK